MPCNSTTRMQFALEMWRLLVCDTLQPNPWLIRRANTFFFIVIDFRARFLPLSLKYVKEWISFGIIIDAIESAKRKREKRKLQKNRTPLQELCIYSGDGIKFIAWTVRKKWWWTMEIKTVENGEYFALKLIRKNYRFAVGEWCGRGRGRKCMQTHTIAFVLFK